MARTAQQRAVHYAHFNQCQKSRSLSSLAGESLPSALLLPLQERVIHASLNRHTAAAISQVVKQQ